MSKVVVVGGGAAGMMAAIVAARNGHDVSLIEHNDKLGKKLFITGKGRCNVTNACEVDKLFDQVVTNPKFLYSAFYGFDNQASMDFFQELGVRLKVERGDRVFPVSDHSSDIINALQFELRRLSVQILLQTEFCDICTKEIEKPAIEETQESEATVKKDKWASKSKKNKGPERNITGVVYKTRDGKKHSIEADFVILATGGISYPLTGACATGIKACEKAGHKVKELYPALVPLHTKEDWCYSLMGLALKNVSVSIYDGKKQLYEAFGEMLFTHYGVSGPLILSASSYITQKCKDKELSLYIDLKPALTLEQLDKRLIREFETNHMKRFKNILGGLFPSKLIPVMIQLSGIDSEKVVGEITREERKAFVALIKKVPLTITKTSDFSEAIVTQGGVNVKDVNPSTMESKIVKGLYLAGEMLDVDALTGGFNLQIAWSTGYLAGNLF